MEDMCNIMTRFLRLKEIEGDYDNFSIDNMHLDREVRLQKFIISKGLDEEFDEFYQRNYDGGYE